MNIDEAKELVFKKKPVLAQIYKKFGHQTWLEYARENFPTAFSQRSISSDHQVIYQKQTSQLAAIFRKVLSPLLSSEKVNRAVSSFLSTRFVSTSDHHGLLCHPFFINNALLRSHPDIYAHQFKQPPNELALISLTCGAVSLANTSYPRGIFFHNQDLEQIRVPFISLRDRHKPVYGYPAIGVDVFLKEIERINTLNLPKSAKKKYHALLNKIVKNNTVWQMKLYSDQLTIMSDMLWDSIFGFSRATLVYLEIETLVRQLLLDIHLTENTLFYKILFNESYRNAYLKHYSGVTGAHDNNSQGSHFFWYIDERKKIRCQLWVVGDTLSTGDNRVNIPLTPKAIGEYLERYEIIPSMALCYSMLSFYYGIVLGGGFSQVQYLAQMKQAYNRVLKTCNEPNIFDQQDIRTDIFTGEYVNVGVSNDLSVTPASLIDIYLYGGDDANDVINRQFQTMSIRDSLDLMMPEFVQIVAGKRWEIYDLQNPPKTFIISDEVPTIKSPDLSLGHSYLFKEEDIPTEEDANI